VICANFMPDREISEPDLGKFMCDCANFERIRGNSGVIAEISCPIAKFLNPIAENSCVIAQILKRIRGNL